MSNTVAQLSSDTKIAISLKKLQGKAHTKTQNELYNEGLPSGITMDSSTVFGETPPINPNSALGDVTNDVVEKVRLTVTFINGSDTPAGKHGFKLSLPSDYETTSNNPKAGTGPFLNDAEIVSSNGLLQLVPPSFDYRYEAVPYYGALASLTSVPLADPRDWNLDYFNGVLFQQDPPVDENENPTYVDAYLYIGKYLTTVVSEAGGTTTFTSLTDTPNDLIGHAGKVVKVNSSENGLEFDTITLPSNFVGDDGDDTVDNEAAGLVPAPAHGDAAAGKYLKADGTWATPPGATYTVFVGDDGDNTVNLEAAGLVPAPSHGDAAAGKYLKADGTWSTPPAGGGGGGGTAASGVERFVYRGSATVNALTGVQFTGLTTNDVPASASLSVYLNGDLLLSGSSTAVSDFANKDPRLPSTTDAQYYVSANDELTFGFAIVDGDVVQIEKLSFATYASNVTQVNAINGLKQDATTGNITVEVNYDGETESIIKKAYDGTGITVDPDNDYLIIHDVTDQQVKYIKANQVGSGQAGIIGEAEDGTYTDGLFVDFIPSTPTGTAVDRFNEVFKYLAPPPAPPVRSIDYSVTGGSVYSGLLSFDETHPDPNGDFENVITYTHESQNGFPTPSVGDNYQADTITHTGGNHDGSDLYFYRVGILSGTQTIEGEINFNVPKEETANGIIQYTEDSFGNGEIGSLIMELNGAEIHSMDLTDVNLGSGQPPNGNAGETSLNADGSGFTHVSELRSAYTEGGKEFPIFKHRTARYKVTPASMQKGLNKLKIIHRMGSDSATNYIEWVVDDTSDSISFSNTSVTPTNAAGSLYISGVRYHSSIDLDYQTDVANAYKAVHSSQQITTTTSHGNGGSGVNLPQIGASEDMEKVINFTQTIPVSAPGDTLLNQTVSTSITVPHPIKGPTSGGNTTTSPILLYTTTSNASPTSEDFSLEEYRLQTDAYNSQTAAQASGFYDTNLEWDPTLHLYGSGAGHETGLQVYNGRLRSPQNTINTTNSGDFRSIGDGGELVTYAGNPDYSLAGGNIDQAITRTYYRWFKNTSGSPKRDIRIEYNGSTNLASAGSAFTASNVKISIKFPQNTSGVGTGWMDANSAYTMFNDSDGDGGYVGSFTAGVSGTIYNYFSFGQKEVLDDEVIIMKIEADPTWTGNINSMAVQWGAAGPALAITAQPLNQVSIDDNGVDVKLSFGQSNAIGYNNVIDLSTSNPVDYNSLYENTGYKKGAFTSVLANGVVMSNANSRFDDGHLGTLQLEVNGVLVADSLVDLTNLTASGNYVDTNGTGFYNLSVATASVYNGTTIQSYNNIYRTVQVQVNQATQVDGHNYYRVIHTVTALDVRETNYCEWVIDSDVTPLETVDEEMENWTDSSSVVQSGIKFFQSPESIVKYRANGVYSNVYSPRTDAVQWWNESRCAVSLWDIVGVGVNDDINIGVTSRSLPSLVPGGHIEPIDVTGSISWTGANKVMPGSLGINSNQSASIRARVHHPLKVVGSNNYVNTSTMSKTNFLIHSGFTDSSTNTSENFSGENYRILSDTDVSDAANISQGVWASEKDLSSTDAGYSDGLCIYNGNLVAPANAGANGDFRNIADGGIYQGPLSNVDYSALSGNTERVYIRPFYNGTGSSKSRFFIDVTGVGTLTSETQSDNNAGDLNANNNTNFKMFIKIVEPASGPTTTGWLDCGEHSNSSVSDNSGCRYGALNNQLPVNIASTNSFEVVMPSGRDLNAAGSNLLLIKIVANDDWVGRITSLGVSL